MQRNDESFLKLFFNEGETICVSPNKFGYHSISQSDFLSEKFTLVSPNSSISPKEFDIKDINLMCLNPVKGFRRDENVTSFRSFLVEIDYGGLLEQREYIASLKMPYSCCIFSGNKSLHYGIVMEEDFLTKEEYDFYAEWILKIVEKADSQTGNPTRSVRYPYNTRHDGRKMVQSLVELKKRINKQDLIMWLSNWPEKKPSLRPKHVRSKGVPNPRALPMWFKVAFKHGLDFSEGRNNAWFKIAIRLAAEGYSEDTIVEILDNYFEEERDFTRKEFLTIIKSAHEKEGKNEQK